MRKVEVQLEDDLTGGAADETIEFGVDGRTYELDLNTKHAATFRRQLAPFVEHARLVHPQRTHTKTRTAASRERSRQIRAWAEHQGLPVSAHGRLPGEVVDQYQSAHHGEPAGDRVRRAGSARRSRSLAAIRPGGRTGRRTGSRRAGEPGAGPGVRQLILDGTNGPLLHLAYAGHGGRETGGPPD